MRLTYRIITSKIKAPRKKVKKKKKVNRNLNLKL